MIEKVVINVVMVGCKLEYMLVFIVVVEVVCMDEFNIYGVMVMIMGVLLVMIVNGFI